MRQAFPRVLRATAFAPAALSLLAARLLRKTAALITPLNQSGREVAGFQLAPYGRVLTPPPQHGIPRHHHQKNAAERKDGS